jgi:hypothetical protein
VERSLQQVSAQARLDKLREELGLPAPAAKPAGTPAAVESAAETPAVAPAPAEDKADEQPAQGGGSAPA